MKKYFILILIFVCFNLINLSAKDYSAKADTLIENITELDEIIVKAKRDKYSKKNNPAYDLMQEIRRVSERYDPYKQPSYSFNFHDKITIALNEMEVNELTPKSLQYLKRYEDFAPHTLKPTILMSLKEKIGTKIYDNSGSKKEKIIVYDSRQEGVDKSFNQDNITKVLEDYLREIDIYNNEISLMQHHFISPLSNIAGDFYHYDITDTVVFTGDTTRYVDLAFAPVSPESFGFNGHLYVSEDSTRFIKKVSLRVPRVLNLNYVDNIFIDLEFERDSLGYHHKTKDDMAMELQIISGTPAFYVRRNSGKNNFSFDKSRHDILERMGQDIYINESNNQKDSQLWNQMRIVPLSRAEMNIHNMNSDMKTSPLFYWGEKIILILANGYIGTGINGRKSKFDFGPVTTLFSYNGLEGFRMRVGGMTTAALSPHVFSRTYVAYGFRDHKWKYMLELEYSFKTKKEHSREFPIHAIRGTYKYDVDLIGQNFKFVNIDNIFLAINRKSNNLATYRRLSELRYILELENNFSIEAGFKHQFQYATKFIPFILADGQEFRRYGLSTFFIKFRYAPGEKFYQGRTTRSPINIDAPVIQLTHEYGPKGFLGGLYTINITEFAAQKRFWLSAAGYLDVILTGGKIWSQVQFPSLLWPSANLSYTLQPESYSLMNPMEFANDWYGALDLTYWMDGLILNRIPLVKKAKLREVFTFKLLTGGLTKKNNPEFNDKLFRFPYDSQTHTLTSKPYMEIGVGLDNILTLFRVDYVWRLTYRNLPGISKSGLRFSFHLNF